MESVVYKIKSDLSNLKAVLKEYDVWIAEYRKEVVIDGKTYAQANSEQAGLMAYYSELADELNIILEDLEMRQKAAKAAAAKKLTKLSGKALTDRQLQTEIEGDPDVIAAWKAVAEVKERHEKAKTALNAFINRGYSLKNLNNARAGGFQNETIYVNES